MKIILPEGFEMPKNVREGDPFDAVITITPSEDGSFMITALNGSPMPEMEEEPETEQAEESGETVAEPEIVLPFEVMPE